MKNHVFRPLFAVIGIIVLVLAARIFYVPKDFGVHERGYMYGWYRQGNIEDWKKVNASLASTVPAMITLTRLPPTSMPAASCWTAALF